MYGSIDISNVIPKYSSSYKIRVYGSTRSENTKYMYITLGTTSTSGNYNIYLCYIDIENLLCKK